MKINKITKITKSEGMKILNKNYSKLSFIGSSAVEASKVFENTGISGYKEYVNSLGKRIASKCSNDKIIFKAEEGEISELSELRGSRWELIDSEVGLAIAVYSKDNLLIYSIV